MYLFPKRRTSLQICACAVASTIWRRWCSLHMVAISVSSEYMWRNTADWNDWLFQRSLRQRLGQPTASSVKDRLTLTVPARGGRGRARSRGRGRVWGGRLGECFSLLPTAATVVVVYVYIQVWSQSLDRFDGPARARYSCTATTFIECVSPNLLSYALCNFNVEWFHIKFVPGSLQNLLAWLQWPIICCA